MIISISAEDSGIYPWAVCLSTKQHEYKENQYNVQAPLYTIDTLDGSIIPGQSEFGRAKYHRRIKVSDPLSSIVSKVFGGIDMPGTYRYISINKAKIYSGYSGIMKPSFESLTPIDDGYLFDGTLSLGMFDIVVDGYEADIFVGHADEIDVDSDLADLMFGSARDRCIESMRERVSSIIGFVVMNGYYTDKQPEIYGSEEADLI